MLTVVLRPYASNLDEVVAALQPGMNVRLWD